MNEREQVILEEVRRKLPAKEQGERDRAARAGRPFEIKLVYVQAHELAGEGKIGSYGGKAVGPLPYTEGQVKASLKKLVAQGLLVEFKGYAAMNQYVTPEYWALIEAQREAALQQKQDAKRRWSVIDSALEQMGLPRRFPNGGVPLETMEALIAYVGEGP